jgi:hypothetical protein
VADIPVTAVGYSIASPTTMRPQKYRTVCTDAGMDPTGRGWGFLRCLDVDGQRLTPVTEDVDYMGLLIAGSEALALEELEVPVDLFPITWRPDDWQLSELALAILNAQKGGKGESAAGEPPGGPPRGREGVRTARDTEQRLGPQLPPRLDRGARGHTPRGSCWRWRGPADRTTVRTS